ncbi:MULTISPECIES: TetR/AcrR family transcriptional regulator [Clostridium]|uniref:TetR/AcrR family transcriptional regulator n=1 Tax=Clostridium TaxID=1485 RepID=UPI0009840545|nr:MULTISPECIES: TetR/AcrR family transcriptional regulator [Clostridium]AQR93423.1 DNA-binding transcriptional repressor FabR [Clostridium saccharoperbutylacetonicum]NSB29121.1 AcrR family transcriptional regulator [Clostridium saccharoperbutylacetonicum]
MKNKYDLRIIRTYKSLTEAFLQLMSEKHFEDITVNELCKKAMIRRTTFYKHFADKYEFFRFFVCQLQTDFDAINPASADYIAPYPFYISIIHHILNFLREHEQFVHMVLGSNLLSTLLDILSEQIIFDITDKIKIGIKKGIAVPASPEIVASFFTGAIIHTIGWWLMQKKKISEEKLIQEVEKILYSIAIT